MAYCSNFQVQGRNFTLITKKDRENLFTCSAVRVIFTKLLPPKSAKVVVDPMLDTSNVAYSLYAVSRVSESNSLHSTRLLNLAKR